jgi:predicted transcriptional regulator
MPRRPARISTILTIRVTPDLDRRLAREARRSRRTRSETARAILQLALQDARVEDPATEARRQSLLASARPSEREAVEFIAAVADLTGWQ